MKLTYNDIVNSKLGKTAIVTGAGPSFNDYKNIIDTKHKNKNVDVIAVNEYFKYLKNPPDYLVLASPHPTDSISAYIEKAEEFGFTIFYADSVDTTNIDWIEENVKTDWFAYDQRHWESKKCSVLMEEFNTYIKENNSYSGFKKYGNNEIMWDYNRYPNSGLSPHGECCVSHLFRDEKVKTIQEKLQEISNFNQHYSSGDSVILHAIAFSIIMGYSKIYLAGMDLDYSLGYADGSQGHSDNSWNHLSKNLVNDLYILNESAKLRNTEIVNLKKNAWYGQFKQGEIT